LSKIKRNSIKVIIFLRFTISVRSDHYS
jgi:hypothetical protein